MKTLRIGAALLTWAIASSVAAQSSSEVEGRFIASNCANCHGTTGKSAGAMPSLAGQPKAYIVEQMRAFRDGKRPATIMHQIAKGYTDAQIDAVAEHFTRQK